MRPIAVLVIAVSAAASALAQTADPNPDLSGNSPYWIKDPISNCWAGNPHPQENESIMWDGACDGGLLSGPGTLTWFQKGVITGRDMGTFKNGMLTGRGRITATDGTSYEGNFPGTGVLTLPDGTKVPARSVRESSGWTIEEPIPGEK